MASLLEEGLFVEQTENASEASAERGKPAAAAAAATGEGDDDGGEREEWNGAPSRRRARASIVYLPTATQYSFAKGCEGPPRPKGRRRAAPLPFAIAL